MFAVHLLRNLLRMLRNQCTADLWWSQDIEKLLPNEEAYFELSADIRTAFESDFVWEYQQGAAEETRMRQCYQVNSH
jgi:hypothetical protein